MVEWIPLIEQHLQKRPGMALQDVYKLLYQGVLGPEHIIETAESFKARLRSEWEHLPAGPEDELLESIRPDQTLARINLRAYRAAGGSLEQLAEACLDTAGSSFQAIGDLQEIWRSLSRYFLENHLYGFSNQEIQSFSRWLDENNFPPVHHSEIYRQMYRPAYRLIQPRR